MKKINIYLAATAVLMLTASCTWEGFENSGTDNPESISFQLLCSNPVTKAGEDLNEEYKGTSLDYYFFQDTTQASKFHYRESISSQKELNYIRDFVPGTEYGGNAFPARAELVRDDGYLTVFVIANLPSSQSTATVSSLADLKAKGVAQTFYVYNSTAKTSIPLSPDDASLSFIMTGQADVKGTREPVSATSTKPEKVLLERIAAKITMIITVPESRESTINAGEIWTPMLNGANVRVYPQNATSNALLGGVDGAIPDNPGYFDYSAFILSTGNNSSESDWKTVDGLYQTKADVGPFYTYPNDWTDGGTDTFMKIIVPWKVTRTDGTTVQREVYYKVLLPETTILANNWYQLTIHLDIVGTEGDPEVELTADYKVVDWFGADPFITQVSDIKYLVVDRSGEHTDKWISGSTGTSVDDTTKLNVFYTNSTQIQYNASPSAEIDWTKSSIYYYDYSGNNPAQKYIVNKSASVVANNGKGITNFNTVIGWFNFITTGEGDALETFLELNHPLQNNLTADFFDVSPYFFDIVLKIPDGSITKEVKFIQYPAIYVVNILSEHYVFVNREGGANAVSSVYSSNTHNANTYLGSVQDRNMGTGDNTNKNQYSITVSVLGSENTISYGSNTNVRMVIGDPRGGATSYNDLGVTNYRPTDGNKVNYIAPKFIVASSYGKTSPTSYEGAQKRCASYQENGYPAGRWRLPTAAEIQFMITMSDLGRIPSLFEPDATSYYWAGGVYGIGRTKTNNKWTINDLSSKTFDTRSGQSGYWFSESSGGWFPSTTYYGVWTRCVYDEWYWGDDKLSDSQANTWQGFKTDFIN